MTTFFIQHFTWTVQLHYLLSWYLFYLLVYIVKWCCTEHACVWL